MFMLSDKFSRSLIVAVSFKGSVEIAFRPEATFEGNGFNGFSARLKG